MNYSNVTKGLIIVGAFALVLIDVTAFPHSASAGYYGSSYGSYNGCNTCQTHYTQPVQYPQIVNNGSYGCGTPYTFACYQQPVTTYIQQPVPVYQPVVVIPPLQATCSANQTSMTGSGTAVWTAYVSGGQGSYGYTWHGTDNIYGNTQAISATYNAPGVKSAAVTVYSGNQSITVNCNNTVNVVAIPVPVPVPTPIVIAPTPIYPVAPIATGLDIGCYADPSKAVVGQPVSWTAEATGGAGPYSFSWTGSENLTGHSNSVIKYYDLTGTKSAIVTVKSANGETATHVCSNTVTVTAKAAPVKKTVAYQAPAPVVTAPAVAPVAGSAMQANSLFSLSNIPWGWVAILVILVLFITVMYLLLNRQKI